jgi:hypothetical protein
MFAFPVHAADEYTIAGEFDGCDFNKLYELQGGGVMECEEYKYFYEFQPRVIASGREVIVVGNERVHAHLYNGSVVRTYVSDEFEGCDFDKVYKLDNGLLFQCADYRYEYAYHPKVKIFFIEGRSPVVEIAGHVYAGTLFKPK